MTGDTHDQLTTLHHAVSDAQQERRGDKPLPTYTFRCSDEERAAADDILKRHGTDVPAFLRACLRLLPQDYSPGPKIV